MITSNAQQATVLQMVANERQRQDAKWGQGNVLRRSPQDGLTVLVEEVGEVAKAILEGELASGMSLDRELVQVAAVAVAMLEARLYPPSVRPEGT